MGLFKRPPETIRELLAQRYAYLVRAAAARSEGAQRYTTNHHTLAVAFYRDVLAGRKRIGSLFKDEREKLFAARPFRDLDDINAQFRRWRDLVAHRATACTYCGAADRLSLDHLVPRLAGGPDDANNLIPACRSCNSSKGARDVMAWHFAKSRFPRRAVVSRYIKLAWRWCEARRRTGNLDRALDADLEIPFDLASLARAMSATGTGGDDGKWPMRWE